MNMYKKAKREKQAQQAQQQRAQAQSQPRAVLIPASATPRTPAGPVRSMEQERAEFALQRIQKLRDERASDVDTQDKTRTYLRSFPALIHMNGLGQALAFCRMKSKPSEAGKETSEHRAYAWMYQLVNDWLCGEGHKGRVFTQCDDVLEAITRGDVRQYMAAQNEAQALLEWAKKFAIALLEKKKDKNGN